jgi:hypothetical protein
MGRRADQLKAAGSLLGAIFLGTSDEQRRALGTIADDVDAKLQRRARVSSEPVVVDAEFIEDEEDDP